MDDVSPSQIPAARGSAQKWRGECLGYFADTEHKLSGLLIRAFQVQVYAAIKPVFPHLVGQKFERLRKLVTVEGPMHRHSATTFAALDNFANYSDLRSLLCHGELKVGVDEDGSRLFMFRLTTFKNNVVANTITTFTHGHADAIRNELAGASNTLKSQIDLLATTLPRLTKQGL